jgi:DNA-binding GntR family transcriptional regulator
MVSGQVEEQLRALIRDSLRPGDKLPSERDLAQSLSVSRPTLREVISSMCRTGELDRRWGVGTFVPVSSRKFQFAVAGGVRPLRIAALEQGFQANVTDFNTELVLADVEAAYTLGVPQGALVWSVDRTLELNNRAVAHLTDYVRTGVNGREIDLSGLGKEDNVDLLTYIEQRSELQIKLLDVVLSVDLASTVFARKLQVEVSSPLMSSRFVGRLQDGEPVSCGSVRYVPGRVELVLRGIGAKPSPNP